MQTTNAHDPRPVPPDPTGRETSRAVMGQFSGGCYLSFFIFVLLGSQAPTTLARGKLNTETLFEELSAFGGVSVLPNKLNKKVYAPTDCVSDADSTCLGFFLK